MAGKRIAIMGAGLGGICAAIRFREEGHENVTVFEKNPKVGGTWFENTYPGCACDVPVALYQYSFAQSPNWTRLFPSSQEIQAYVEEVVDRYQLRSNIRFNTSVASAVWDEHAKTWTITTEQGDVTEADILVGALGQLNRPNWAEIEGSDTFDGPMMHSAAWDHSVDLAGKRVGVIGSAASAIQLIPEVAKIADKLVVFQRTPNWVVPRNDREVTIEERTLAMTRPEVAIKLGAMNREIIYENADNFFWQAFKWTPEGREANTTIALNHLHDQVADPELRAKLTPDYPVGCKRILIADNFYPAMCRDNVALETGGIARIKPEGVEMKDGTVHELDVLVFATGFETTGWKWSADVTGEGGQHLNDVWSTSPQAYRGVTVSGFPNFYVLYGPNTNLGHNSIIDMLEKQVNYAVKCVKAMEDAGASAMQPKPDAQAAWNKWLQDTLATTVWADPQCDSWYKNEDGLITQNWAGSSTEFGEAVKEVKTEDYAFN